MHLTISDSKNCQVTPFDGTFSVFETEKYVFHAGKEYSFDHVILEGVKDKNTGNDKQIFFNTFPERYFSNCLGLFTIFSPDGQKITELNILTKKLNHPEAITIFEYVFQKNYEIFDSFLKRHGQYTADEGSTQNFELSLFKYLGVTNELLEILKRNYHQINHKTAYKLESKINKVDYKERLVTPKSIEWLITNLDEFDYDVNFKFHPGAVRVGSTYALPYKIITEEKYENFDVYENRIIKGTINKLGKIIQNVSDEISRYLVQDNADTSGANLKYASFESLKKVILKSELKRLKELKSSYKAIKKNYHKLFKHVVSVEKKPRMTHVFKTKKHYRDIYNKILALYRSSINYPGTYLVLGIKNLDILYEYYNFYVIIDIFQKKYGPPEIVFDGHKLLYASFYEKNCIYRIYYQLQINKKGRNPQFPWIKLFANTNQFTHYSPDIVIEREENRHFNYAVLDAKYSSRSLVKKETLYTLVGKYFFSLAYFGEPYKKIDFLYILYPNSGGPDFLTQEDGYYPEMGAIPSSPQNIIPLIDIILHILKKWND